MQSMFLRGVSELSELIVILLVIEVFHFTPFDFMRLATFVRN